MKKIKNIKLLLVAMLVMFGMDAFAQLAPSATNMVYKDNLVYIISDDTKATPEVLFYGISAAADADAKKTLTLVNQITAAAPSTGVETTYNVVGFWVDDFSAPAYADGWAAAKAPTEAWETIDMTATVEGIDIEMTVKDLTTEQITYWEGRTTKVAPAYIFKSEAFRPLTDATKKWEALKTFKLGDARTVIELPAIDIAGLKSHLTTIDLSGVINDGVDGVTVPANWATAFSSLENVTLPENADVVVGKEAFFNTPALKSVTFTSTKKVIIGESAFRAAPLLTAIDFAQVEEIGEMAFQASGLTTVEIKAGVKKIGENAFYAATNPAITEVIFASTQMTEVPAVFGLQDKITKVTVSGPATKIAAGAFADAKDIQEIDLSAATALTTATDAFDPTGKALTKVKLRGSLLTTVPFVVAENANLTDITFPAGLTGALPSFQGCKKLKNLGSIPDGVTAILGNGFYGCDALETVDFDSDASGLLTIGDMAFQKDAKLKSFAFAKTKKLQTIGVQAFEFCEALESADLSATMVRVIGSAAFRMAANSAGEWQTALATVSLPVVTDMKNPADDSKDYTDYLLIGQNAFWGCADVTEIGNLNQPKILLATAGGQFAHSGLTGDISFAAATHQVKDGDDNLVYQFTEIPGNAFYDVPGITSITLPVGVTTIGGYAFFDCEALATVTYGNIEALASIGSYAFNGCALTTVDLSGAVGRNADDTDYLFKTINPFTFANNKSLATVKLPNQINEIGEGAFCDDIALTSINLDETDIWELNNIFTSYTGVYPYNKEISLDKLATLTLNKKEDIKLNIAGEERGLQPLTDINSYALQFTGLTEIVIPETVEYFGVGVCRACTNLKNFTWKNAKQNYLTKDCFRGDIKLESVIFLSTETATGAGLSDEEVFFMCDMEKLTVYVTLDSYNAAVAAGMGNENRKYSKLEVMSNRVFQFAEANLAADGYYYATYYNPDNSSWFDPEVFDVYTAVIDGSKIVLKPATVEGGVYKVAKLNINDEDEWDDDVDGVLDPEEYVNINMAQAICVVRSKDINAKPQLNSNDGSEYKTTLPTDNDLQYCFFDGYAGGSKLNFVYKFGKNKKTGKVAFFRITSGEFKAGAVYVESNYSARSLDSLDIVIEGDGESTGIKDINTVEENTVSAPIYNLQGVRVNKAGKGLFIQNGKKILK